MFIKREHSHLSTTATARDGNLTQRFGDLRTAAPPATPFRARVGEQPVWGRRKPLVISSVAPNNSLTAPLMHSKMPIETADGETLRRETLSLSAVKEAGCLSIHTENYGLSRISDQMEEKSSGGNPQAKLTFTASLFPTKQPTAFLSGFGGLIHLVSGRLGAEPKLVASCVMPRPRR